MVPRPPRPSTSSPPWDLCTRHPLVLPIHASSSDLVAFVTSKQCPCLSSSSDALSGHRRDLSKSCTFPAARWLHTLPAAGPSSTDLHVAPSRTPRPLHTARSCCPLCLNLLLSSLLSSSLKGRFRRCLLQEAPLGSHSLCTKSSTALGEARL